MGLHLFASSIMIVVGKIRQEVCETNEVLHIERAVRKYFYEKCRQFDMYIP